MSTEIAMKLPGGVTSATTAPTTTDGTPMSPTRLLLWLSVALLTALAWYVRELQPYTSASDVGYWMGVAGGSLMAALLLYPLRKRLRWTQPLGALRHWFRFHMVAGIGGPLLVLYHSTFHVGSFNAAIALSSMLLVAASGIVGRFLYRRIHHGLYGRQATFKELQEQLGQHLTALENGMQYLPAVKGEVEAYLLHAGEPRRGKLVAILHFLSLGAYRRASLRRVRKAISATSRRPSREKLYLAVADTLSAAQKASQFNAYVRLFALWHVIHIPFLGMLVLTAVAHVIAVHTY
ncbi:MAG TPA: hypothetical protein VFW68_08225 [Rhodocyclaceae bacterium]|nr:hypothetical protein [Rhodocyclaceae bacterium]